MQLYNLRRKDFDFWTSLQTRWGDMDSLGHINHTNYLSYMESARVNVLVDLGLKGIRKNIDSSTILASMEVDYLVQCTHPASLEIGHRISRVGNKSFDFISVIFEENIEKPICTALFKLVAFNYRKNQTVSVPENIKQKCRPL